ncbi:MAG: branched-chain amino acid ABC transporter permease [Candidatus Korarchaeota archaeon]|nr:branched-chain amino acid ABC transporter permease [Candidatus Korarchaeota archaeon]
MPVVSPELLGASMVNGLLLGVLYGLAALGLSLIWGIMRVVNLSHGATISLGMFLTYIFVVSPMSLPLWAGVALSALIGCPLGMLFYGLAVHRVLGGPELSSLLSTFGLGLVVRGILEERYGGAARTIYSPGGHVVRLFGVSYSYVQLVAVAVAVAATLATYLLVYRTWFGRAVRAIIMDKEAAELMGVDTTRILLFSFALGVTMAVLSGGLIALIYSFTPLTGLTFELYSFVIVVLGGLGSPIGSLLGGVIVGLAEQVSALYIPVALSPMVAFIILIAVLALRPTGIFGGM